MTKFVVDSMRMVLPVILAMAAFDALAQADSVSSRMRPRFDPPPPPEAAAFTQSDWMGITARSGRFGAGCNRSTYQNNAGVPIMIAIWAPADENYAVLYVKNRYADPWQTGAYSFASGTAMAYVPPGAFYCPASSGSNGYFRVTVLRNNVAPNDYMWPVPPPPQPTVRSETFVGMCFEQPDNTDFAVTRYYSVYRIEYNMLNGVQPPPGIDIRLSPGYSIPEAGPVPPRCADVRL